VVSNANEINLPFEHHSKESFQFYEDDLQVDKQGGEDRLNSCQRHKQSQMYDLHLYGPSV